MEDVHTYAHLLSVALNSKLCQGAINEAIEIGEDKIISVTTVVCIWVATVYALAFIYTFRNCWLQDYQSYA